LALEPPAGYSTQLRVALTGDGSFTYKPAARFKGKVTFTDKPSDGLLDGAVATVTIKVA
jgi:hypothetical protein